MAAEKRIVFGIPRHDMVIVGTTDTDYSGAQENVTTEPEDVKYLLSIVKQYFPGIKVQASDIVASYAGVRPLVQDESESEGKTSREHTIFTDLSGVTFMAGGKYTTYRLMAEQAVGHCLKHFPIEDRVRFNFVNTATPINPLITTESFSDLSEVHRAFSSTKLSSQEMTWLVERHGAEAEQMISELTIADTYSTLEARHAIENTMCMNLLDFYARRVPFILSRKDHGLSELDKVVQVFKEALFLSDSEIQSQKQELRDYIKKEFRWRERLGVDTSP